MALAMGTVVGNESSIRISNAKNMFFLRLYHLGLMRAEIGSIVPLGRGHFPHDSRHFAPGYYRDVPPGQKLFTREAPRIISALMDSHPRQRLARALND